MGKNGFLENEKKGIFFAVLAALAYSLNAVTVKLAVEVPPVSMVFFRNLTCLILLIPIFLKNKKIYKTTKPKLVIIRAFMSFFGLTCFYFATKHLLIVNAVMLINASPLFVPIVLLIWDKVKIPTLRVLAIITGFIGILFILQPNLQFMNIAGFIGLTAGVFVSISYVTLKKLSATEKASTIMFYFFAGNTVLSFIPTMFELGTFQNPTTWVYLVMVGMTSFLYQTFTTQAYANAAATKVSTITGYLAVVFSGIFGWTIWNRVPDVYAFIGIALVISSGIAVALYKDKTVSAQQIAVDSLDGCPAKKKKKK